MIPELGHVGLILALQLALLQAVLGFSGARGRVPHILAARRAALAQAVCVALGFGALVHAFAVNDFSVLNVAEHASRHLPLAYRVTAAWGSHEGSILLWALILAGWTGALAWRGFRGDDDALAAAALGVMGTIAAGMLAFILLTSNPFQRLDPPPPDGLDLNPLLQDPGMIAHPPLLYMGYVGFSVAFAFAVAALLCGRLDAGWAARARRWTLSAWLFLTLGIAVGSGWAYYELGWGGWWFWDPTENASLMPWLVGTALLHALAVAGRSGGLQLWSVVLAIGAFGLSLVGTFLVRSGVLSSVHAFAQDPARGFFLLLLLALLVGAALTALALRVPKVRPSSAPDLRATLLLGGGVLLVVATGTVLLGTLYPLILDALGQGKVSVGPPYFNAVFVPLMVPVLLLIGVSARAGSLARLAWPAFAALAAGSALSFAYGEWRWQAALGGTLGAWIALTAASGFADGRRSLARLGVALAHGGLAVGIVGIGVVSAFESERTLTLARGEQAAFAGFEITFDGISEIAGPNYSAVRGSVRVGRDGRTLAELHPEKRIYHASRQPMTESAIRSRADGDLYVVLGDAVNADTWTLRLFHKPLMAWLWVGALLMAAGALLAVCARRAAADNGGAR